MLLFCCSFYPLSSDLIEMISFSLSLPRTPHALSYLGYRLYFRTKYSAGPIFSGLGIVLLLFMAAWRGLLVVPNAPAAGPVSLKTVSRCAETLTRGRKRTLETWSPLLPRQSWVSVRTFKFLAVSPQLQPHTVKSEVNKHHLN